MRRNAARLCGKAIGKCWEEKRRRNGGDRCQHADAATARKIGGEQTGTGGREGERERERARARFHSGRAVARPWRRTGEGGSSLLGWADERAVTLPGDAGVAPGLRMSIAAVPEEHCAVLGWRARPAILPHEAQACRDDGRDESIAQGSQHPISMITHGSQHTSVTPDRTRQSAPDQHDHTRQSAPDQHDRTRQSAPDQHDRTRQSAPDQHDHVADAPKK